MIIEVAKERCKWVVNGKPYSQLNIQEKRVMDDFFRELKIQSDLTMQK